MQCNIDAKGKAVRLIGGVIACFAAVALVAWFEGALSMYIAIALIAIGAFCIFEGWKGWCALRAMGLKTRL